MNCTRLISQDPGAFHPEWSWSKSLGLGARSAQWPEQKAAAGPGQSSDWYVRPAVLLLHFTRVMWQSQVMGLKALLLLMLYSIVTVSVMVWADVTVVCLYIPQSKDKIMCKNICFLLFYILNNWHVYCIWVTMSSLYFLIDSRTPSSGEGESIKDSSGADPRCVSKHMRYLTKF